MPLKDLDVMNLNYNTQTTLWLTTGMRDYYYPMTSQVYDYNTIQTCQDRLIFVTISPSLPVSVRLSLSLPLCHSLSLSVCISLSLPLLLTVSMHLVLKGVYSQASHPQHKQTGLGSTDPWNALTTRGQHCGLLPDDKGCVHADEWIT